MVHDRGLEVSLTHDGDSMRVNASVRNLAGLQRLIRVLEAQREVFADAVPSPDYEAFLKPPATPEGRADG